MKQNSSPRKNQANPVKLLIERIADKAYLY
ncbi:hypothetical protein BH11BAC2_BH11BAC2_04750 [soil metagenome]